MYGDYQQGPSGNWEYAYPKPIYDRPGVKVDYTRAYVSAAATVIGAYFGAPYAGAIASRVYDRVHGSPNNAPRQIGWSYPYGHEGNG